jgi:hypothetical protein
MKATKRITLFTVALVVASAAAPAFGQSEMEIRNRALESFEEGMKLFEASKFARAVAVFEEALGHRFLPKSAERLRGLERQRRPGAGQ